LGFFGVLGHVRWPIGSVCFWGFWGVFGTFWGFLGSFEEFWGCFGGVLGRFRGYGLVGVFGGFGVYFFGFLGFGGHVYPLLEL